MRPRLPVGQRRTRVEVLVPAETPDGFGGVRRTWSVRQSIWAAVEPLRADETARASSPGQLVTHRVTLRWASAVDGSMRLRRGARLFAVRTVYDPDERRRDLVCLCEEVKP